ncbi:MAG: hypothetical protein MJY58_00455 [Bacteroidaceae bacterium]|nr:hypothetical protein [Bacteroidaceae bacterium]
MGADKDDRLLEILDSFLEKQPAPGGNSDELDLPVAGDYLAQCADAMPDMQETGADGEIRSRTDELLESFAGNGMSVRNAGDGCAPDADAGHASYSETLARIFLKQHRYDRALEIIKSLYLNFPNKSVYFADQIRYLEKLIRINQKN